RSAEKMRADPEVAAALAQGGILAYVPLVLDAGRPVKANLSLDAGLLNAIDEAAERRGLTRSAFRARAAREKNESEGLFRPCSLGLNPFRFDLVPDQRRDVGAAEIL